MTHYLSFVGAQIIRLIFQTILFYAPFIPSTFSSFPSLFAKKSALCKPRLVQDNQLSSRIYDSRGVRRTRTPAQKRISPTKVEKIVKKVSAKAWHCRKSNYIKTILFPVSKEWGFAAIDGVPRQLWPFIWSKSKNLRWWLKRIHWVSEHWLGGTERSPTCKVSFRG